MKNTLRIVLLLASAAALGACLDFEDPFGEEATVLPDSGDSDVGAPASVIGQTMVQTVASSDGQPGTIALYSTITYSFIDAHTILGDGMNVIATESWTYSATGGNKGVLYLEYGEGQGRSKELLAFKTENSGTYRSEINLDADGSFHWHEGTFEIKPVENNPNDPNNPVDPNECTSADGKLTIFTTNGTSEDISVYVDGGFAGLLTHYYTSGEPTCGAPSDIGFVTLTLPAGSHSVSADSASYTWSGGSVQVQACGCSLYTLY